MKKSYLLRKILMVGLLFVIFSCDKEEFTSDVTDNSSKESNFSKKDDVDAVFSGPEVAVGNGYVHSWISFNKFQTPLEIGVEMTPEIFDNLPLDSNFDKLVLPLPIVAQEATPFDHIEILWNPESYSPIEGFKNAHFDFLFFMITMDERREIPAWSEETDILFSTYPPKNSMPFDYSPIQKEEGSFEKIGRYWLWSYYENKQPLTHTVALGTFNGAYIFIAPVASLEFMKSNQKLTETFSQPIDNPSNRRLPMEYNVYINNKGNYCITLGNFIRR